MSERTVESRGWSVAARLLFINVLLVLSLLVVSTIAWRAIDVQSRAMSELALVSKAARFHQDVDTVQANLRADVSSALAGVAQSDRQKTDLERSLLDDAREFRNDLEALEKFDLPPELIEGQRKLHSVGDVFVSKVLEIGLLAIRDASAASKLQPGFDASAAQLRSSIDRQTAAFTVCIAAASADEAGAAVSAKRWLAVATVIISITVGVLVMLASVSIRRSLLSVSNVAMAIADGDLTVRNRSPGDDEVGRLAKSINAMADNLNHVIGRLRSEAGRNSFAASLADAMEMAGTEGDVHAAASTGMQTISESVPTELLLADSSNAHVELAAKHLRAGSAGCGVDSPFNCVAVRRGATQNFPDSEALDACPRLRGRSGARLSAVCVPISFMGRSLGVLHAAAPIGEGPTAEQSEQLGMLGLQIGTRIGTIRAFQATQLKATTDSLTGLYNRSSLEDRLRALAGRGETYALVLCDLDNFKRVNDTRGHVAGDRALRLFADVLRENLRERDVAARWGGEEFLLMIHAANATTALEVVERMRESLALAHLKAGTPKFTSSFGIADTLMSASFEQMIRIADEALYRAKAAGRDCAIVGDPDLGRATITRRETERTGSFETSLFDTQS